jgi:hypothetical protein
MYVPTYTWSYLKSLTYKSSKQQIVEGFLVNFFPVCDPNKA